MASSKPLVLLTGPTGFVGAHILSLLLSSGYRVRGTVRSQPKTTFLSNKYPDQVRDGTLSFTIVPDIQSPHALDDAVQDVDYICHVASPYFTETNNPLKDLIEPAVNGTANVLASALKAPNLKRLTVMSSFASVVDLDKNPRAGYVYTDKDWDPVTLEKGSEDGVWGYHASKTFAERKAWDIWNEAKPSWDLVTFCPPMIYGPPIQEIDAAKGIAGMNTSVKRLLTGITGKDPAFAPRVSTPGLPASVDVRDIAASHLNALPLPKGTSGRFLLCGAVAYYEDGLAGLREKGVQGLGEPGKKCDPSTHFAIDVSKAQEVLGIQFTPFQKTVEDVWERAKELELV
jgi:nucleoside-diphosphate-sugar epimerase